MSVNAPPRPKPEAEHPSGDARFKLIDRALKRLQFRQDALIEVLHTAQEAFGYLDDDVLLYAAQQLKLPLSWVYGVATFYHFFSLKPQGEHTCIVCLGTACYVKKSGEVLAALEQEYGLKPGQTTADKKLSLAQARCVGSCGLAPVVVMDGTVHGKETAESTLKRVREALLHARPTEPEPAK
ncbi:MAG: bidirectional hydrogenase complex protein HoxE [Anaerolineales bacterium]|nr:bidirectional hydrogenase complex protein HoxE [Anaerolineales bacterium]